MQKMAVTMDSTASASEETRLRKFLTRFYGTAVAGTGFMCDAFDLFVINLVVVILQQVYPTHGDPAPASAISTAALVGAIAGQLVFGVIADRVGRRIGFIVTLSLIIIGAVASACSFGNSVWSIYISIAICRFVLGFGIGGEYPLSATIASESATDQAKRGRDVALVFSMQGVGIVLSPLVVMALIGICGMSRLDLVWRLSLAFGAVPGIFMIYSRIRMKETDHFTAKKNQRVPLLQIIREYWRPLIGTAGTWFLFDITFYANGLFNGTILEVLGFGESLMDTAVLSLILAVLALPGYYTAVFLIDRLGRRDLMMLGFFFLGLVYVLMGTIMSSLVQSKAGFIILYGLSFFFSNAGPNTVTYVLPSEAFPTKVRATCHGISAAAGKLGAVLGGGVIKPMFDARGGNSEALAFVLLVCGMISFVGLLVTYIFCPETNNMPMAEAANQVLLPTKDAADREFSAIELGDETNSESSTKDNVDVDLSTIGISDSQSSTPPNETNVYDGELV